MEARCLLALIVWDGGPDGTGTEFGLAANWVGDVRPGPNDDAIIGSEGPTIAVNSFLTVRSVSSVRRLEVIGSITTSGANEMGAPVIVRGGSVIGGLWTFSGAGNRFEPTFSGGSVQNATVSNELVFGSGGELTLVGTTSFTGVRMTGTSTLWLAAGFVLNMPVTAEGPASGTRVVGFAGGTGTVNTIGPSGSIRLVPGTGGDLVLGQASPGGVVNNGRISSEATGRSLRITASPFTSSGTLEATGGELRVSSASWTSTGPITASGAALNFSGSWSLTGSLSLNATALNLGGQFTRAGLNLAGWTRSGGTVSLQGSLDNAGGTLTLDGATGPWVLSGGTIRGGSLSLSAADRLVYSGVGGTLDSVAINRDVVLENGLSVTFEGTTTAPAVRLTGASTLRVGATHTLNSPVTAEGPVTGRRLIVFPSNSSVGAIGTSGSIRLVAGVGGELTLESSSTEGIANNGLIAVEDSNQTLRIDGRFTNAGTVRVAAGTLNFLPTTGGPFRNIGTIAMSGGTFDLSGRLNATAGIGTWNRTGGTVNLRNTVDVTGAQLTLNRQTGSWTLLGGAVRGGTLAFADGERLIYTSAGGALDAVAVQSDIVLSDTGGSVQITQGTTFPAVRLAAGNTTLNVGGLLNGAVFAEGAAPGTRFVRFELGSSSATGVGPQGTIDLVAGSGGDLSLSGGNSGFVNNGVISGAAAGRAVSLGAVTNNGLLRATAGQLSLSADFWSNPGTISVVDAALRVRGLGTNTGSVSVVNSTVELASTFTAGDLRFANWTRVGGTVNLTGTFDNVGGSFRLDASTGSWNLVGGTVRGGSLEFAEGSSLRPTPTGGTLTNVAISGEIVLATSGSNVLITGSTNFTAARLTATSAALRLAPGYVLNAPVIAEGSATGNRFVNFSAGGSGNNTIGPGGSIRLAPGSGGGLIVNQSTLVSLVNNGLIAAEAAGQTLSITSTFSFTNNGVLRASAGTLNVAPNTFTNLAAGTLTGGVYVAAGGTLAAVGGGVSRIAAGTSVELGAGGEWTALATLATNNGTLRLSGGRGLAVAGGLGNTGTLELSAGSVLTVGGGYTQSAAGVLASTLRDAPVGPGRVVATGQASLAGTLVAAYESGYAPTAINTRFDVVSASSLSGAFAAVNVQPQLPGRKLVAVSGPTTVQLLFTSQADFNNDGVLTPVDVFAFLSAYWNPATPIGQIDFDGDGVRQPADLFAFLTVYFAR